MYQKQFSAKKLIQLSWFISTSCKHYLQITAKDKFYNLPSKQSKLHLAFPPTQDQVTLTVCPLCQEATRLSSLSSWAHKLLSPFIYSSHHLSPLSWLLHTLAAAGPHETAQPGCQSSITWRLGTRECMQLSQEGQPLLHSHEEGTTQAELSQHELSLRHEAWRTTSSQTMVPHRRRTSGKPHRQSLNCQPLQRSKTKDNWFHYLADTEKLILLLPALKERLVSLILQMSYNFHCKSW